MARRINKVTGQNVQSARTTASKLRNKVKVRRFMSDDSYVRAMLKAEPNSPTPELIELIELEKLQAAKRFVKEIGGIERAIEVLELYEQLVSQN